MLNLIVGRNCTKRDEQLFRLMQNNMDLRTQIYLVPEQNSHEADRLIRSVFGNESCLNTEILTFTTLSNRILASGGGVAKKTLDDGGRILLIHNALKSIKSQLTVYARPSSKVSFYESLLHTIDELKQGCITPEQLVQIADMLPDDNKIRDLSFIYSAYNYLAASIALDPRDRLSFTNEKLRVCGWGKGKDIYINGFNDFSVQEEHIIENLIRQSNSVTISLVCDDIGAEEYENSAFMPALRTIEHLNQMVINPDKDINLMFVDEVDDTFCKQILHLERNLFSYQNENQERVSAENRIELYQANSIHSEIEYIASQIRKKVSAGELRYRDIIVTARTLEQYESIIHNVFSRFDIPIFSARKIDVMQKLVFSFVSAALKCVSDGFLYEDVFAYLKTGLANITVDECDMLENYVYLWDIKGRKWTQEEAWSMNPYGYEEVKGDKLVRAEKMLEEINEIRGKVLDPLLILKNNKIKTGKGYVLSLYNFLNKVDICKQIELRNERLRRDGDLTSAEEDIQLWDILCDAMEQTYAIVDDSPMEMEEFTDLFRLVLSQYSVGTIPVAIDRVTVGTMDRLVGQKVRHLFLIGADDQTIPKINVEPGVLNDEERQALIEIGLRPRLKAEERLLDEYSVIYQTCTQPTDALTISWAKEGTESEKQHAFFVDRILDMFEDIRITEETNGYLSLLSAPATALDLSADSKLVRNELIKNPKYTNTVQHILNVDNWNRGSLEVDTAKNLYGKKIMMSASKIDKFESCHFSYFLQFGLKAKARRKAGFNAQEFGTFIHYVLEHMLRYCQTTGGVKSKSKEELRYIVDSITDEYMKNELNGLVNEDARFVYLFNRLRSSVWRIAENVIEELQVSEFEPLYFELGFGGRDRELPPIESNYKDVAISLTGFVDRVDGWTHNGRLYLRVIDYKSGKKSFDLTDVYNGMSLQMLIYLFSLKKDGNTLFNNPVESAGILYLPARDEIINTKEAVSAEEVQSKVDAALKRSGLILNDQEVIDAMEHPVNGKYRFMPVKSNKGGIQGALASAEELGLLQRHVEDTLREICRQLSNGNIDADPFWKSKEKTACKYCDYKQACMYIEGRNGDRQRYLKKLKNEEFYNLLNKGKEESENGIPSDKGTAERN